MEAVCSRSLASVRADSSRAETFEPLKKGCGVWLFEEIGQAGEGLPRVGGWFGLLVSGVF